MDTDLQNSHRRRGILALLPSSFLRAEGAPRAHLCEASQISKDKAGLEKRRCFPTRPVSFRVQNQEPQVLAVLLLTLLLRGSLISRNDTHHMCLTWLAVCRMHDSKLIIFITPGGGNPEFTDPVHTPPPAPTQFLSRGPESFILSPESLLILAAI